MDKRIEKRHKRAVLRKKQKAKQTEPDVRTPDEIKAAREASRPAQGWHKDPHANFSKPPRRSRAGSVAPFSREGLPDRAWFRINSLRQPVPDASFLPVDAYAPRPVGTRRPNAWGFHDMQGNVWEWCSSPWRPYPYRRAEEHASQLGTVRRLLRGGGFADSAALLHPSLRHAERPHHRLRWNGLRLARDVPLGSE